MTQPSPSEPEVRRFADDSAEEAEEQEPGPLSVAPDLPADRFLDRDISWLAFNERVLALAEDDSLPVLERVRFAAIFARNLDEFFMIRVAGLRRRMAAGIVTPSVTGHTPRERLARIAQVAHDLANRHAQVFTAKLCPALASAGVSILRWADLNQHERAEMREVFTDRILPVLTPLAVDPAHPFPYISGLSLNLAVVVRDEASGDEHFARVKVPPLLPRYLSTNAEGTRFIPVEEVIAAYLPDLFAGMTVVEASTFRVTRNEDLELDDDVDNVLKALERELSRRRFGAAVRLEVANDASDRVLDLLMRELGMSQDEVYRLPTPLDLAGLWRIADLDLPALRFPAMVPVRPAALAPSEGPPDFFSSLRRGDVLLHHPYDSFTTTVQAFLQQAAADPDTYAIKLTLYRTSGESPIVDALVEAASAGKQVLVVVEIKARFDEHANIRWARKLEQAGCHVVYGLVGLKTHCKLALVVRSEQGQLRRYVHVGTGNYNHKTARVYEDLGLLTADPVLGADVADLFNHLSGYTRQREYDTLLVAPDMLRSRLTDLIRREAQHAAAGRPAGISAKMNALSDPPMVDELYRASAAGVPIDLLVRSICVLRPGVPGLSDRVRVRSVLGRFLEHSRIYRFENGGSPVHYIGSADIMDRNLDRRVEALAEVRDAAIRRRLDDLLALAWSDDIECWHLGPDGSWKSARELRGAATPLRDMQQVLASRRQAGAALVEGD